MKLVNLCQFRSPFVNSVATMVLLLCLGGTASADVVYDVNADYTAGYAAGLNPNGVWTYGWTPTLTSSLTRYTTHQALPYGNSFNAWYDPNNYVSGTPFIFKNEGGNYVDTNINIPAGALILHGGGKDSFRDYSNALFTAPTAGSYSLNTTFIGRQPGELADVHILSNGTSLFSSTVTASQGQSFSALLVLAKGDTVDFAVGFDPQVFAGGSVELRATLTATAAVPEPASMISLGLGIVGVVGVARRRSTGN